MITDPHTSSRPRQCAEEYAPEKSTESRDIYTENTYRKKKVRLPTACPLTGLITPQFRFRPDQNTTNRAVGTAAALEEGQSGTAKMVGLRWR